MDARYRHLWVDRLWSTQWTYNAWWIVEKETIHAQLKLGIIPPGQGAEELLAESQPEFNEATIANIQFHEHATRHDVAAFLAEMREWFGEPHGRWIHYGLTSSDLVDTAQAMRFKAMEGTYHEAIDKLHTAIAGWMGERVVVLGRTHGEPAEPIRIDMRARHWWENVYYAGADLRASIEAMQRMKLSGPVGSFAHNPPEIEAAVASALSLTPQGVGSSQIVPRVHLAHWASAAARLAAACAKIAMDLRLMLLLADAKEIRPEGQVGSSAMPHKTNPIRAEQITGLQRVAAGYASMLQPLDMWLERDISNSSVERIAVPELWHIVMHVIKQTTELLDTVHLSHGASTNLKRAAPLATMHRDTLRNIRAGMPAPEARERAMNPPHPLEMSPAEWDRANDFHWFSRNYPQDPE